MKFPVKSPWPWTIFGLALLLRTLHWISIQQTLPQMPLLGDGKVFDHYAWKIATGVIHTEIVRLHLLPVYPAFLSTIYKLAGHAPSMVIWTQIVLGSLTCVLCYKIGVLLWNQKAGLIAGLIASFHGLFIFFDTLLLRPSLINFLQAFLFYWLVTFSKKQNLFASGAAGACLGTLVLLRTSFWFTVPGVIFWILTLIFKRRDEHDRVRRPALTLGVFFLCLILSYQGWLFWLDQALPKRDFLLTETGLQFYLGNNPTASGTYVPQKEFPPTIYGQSVIARKHVEKETKRPVSLKEFDQYWFKKGLDFILQNPGRWLALEFKKLFLIFNGYEIPGSLDFDVLRKRSSVVSLPLFSFGLIAPLGLLGIVMMRGRFDAGTSFLLIFSGLYLLTLLITYVQMDLRLPLQLPLILFASFALVRIPELFISGQKRELILAAVLFLLFSGFVNWKTHLPRAQFQKNAEALLVRIQKSASPTREKSQATG